MLKLRIGNIPLRIHPSFLITAVILGSNWLTAPDGISFFLLWMAILTVSIIVHELGHALMGKAFGLTPAMDLHGMGGTCSWTGGRELTRRQSILVSLAGPLAGVLLGGAVMLARMRLNVPIPERGARLNDLLIYQGFEFSFWINIAWSGFNLLPILPLDGGNVFRDLVRGKESSRRETVARVVSIVTAVGAGLATFLILHDWWAPLLCALFAVSNFRALREMTLAQRDEPLEEPLQRAVSALEDHDGPRTVSLARPLLQRAASSRMKAQVIQVLALGLLLENKVEEADAVMRTLPSGFKAPASYLALRQRATGAS